MSIIAIITTIISLVRLIPSAFALINEIIQLFQSLKPGTANQAALMTDFKAAVKTARETKDVSALEAFHKRLGALCGASGMRDDVAVSPTEGN